LTQCLREPGSLAECGNSLATRWRRSFGAIGQRRAAWDDLIQLAASRRQRACGGVPPPGSVAVRRRTVLVRDAQRYRLALLIHEQPTIRNAEAGHRVGFSERQVRRWRQRWAAGDFTVEDHEGRGRKATFSPDGSSDGRCHRLPNRARHRRAVEPTVVGRSDTAGHLQWRCSRVCADRVPVGRSRGFDASRPMPVRGCGCRSRT